MHCASSSYVTLRPSSQLESQFAMMFDMELSFSFNSLKGRQSHTAVVHRAHSQCACMQRRKGNSWQRWRRFSPERNPPLLHLRLCSAPCRALLIAVLLLVTLAMESSTCVAQGNPPMNRIQCAHSQESAAFFFSNLDGQMNEYVSGLRYTALQPVASLHRSPPTSGRDGMTKCIAVRQRSLSTSKKVDMGVPTSCGACCVRIALPRFPLVPFTCVEAHALWARLGLEGQHAPPPLYLPPYTSPPMPGSPWRDSMLLGRCAMPDRCRVVCIVAPL